MPSFVLFVSSWFGPSRWQRENGKWKMKGISPVKRCPVCQREYPDKSSFCNQDGSKLVPIAQHLQARLIIRSQDGGEREVALVSPVSTIGKTPDNTIVVTDSAISRKHAQIEQRQVQCFIKDLGSSNGTFLNGAKIDDQGTPLNEGDEIGLGRTKMRFHLTADISQMETVESPQVEPSLPRASTMIDEVKPVEKP